MTTRFTPVLLLGICLAVCIPAIGQDLPPEDVLAGMNSARRVGWELAMVSIKALKDGNQEAYPGIKAWIGDFDKATKGIDLDISPDQWPAVDIDALLTHNPNFWQAHYEIAPGDPALNMLHAGLLLSVGESTRAAYLLVVARQRSEIPEELVQGLQALLANTQVHGRQSNAVTMRGIKLHDAGDYPGALKEYQAALALWPQNGFAYYEMGYTQREQQMVQAGQKKLEPSKVIVNLPKNSPEVDAAFAKARQFDPFQLKAYQGTDQEVIRGLMVLSKKGMPTWQKLAKNPEKMQKDKVLEDLADACQQASIHDLALVTRQILVARRTRYAPADHPFISTSLRKLAPGEQTEAVLERLATGVLTLRQLVAPEPEKP